MPGQREAQNGYHTDWEMCCDMLGPDAHVERDYETSTAQLYCNGMIIEAQACAHVLRTMSALPQMSKATTYHRLKPRPAPYTRQLWPAQVQLTARLVKHLLLAVSYCKFVTN